MFISSFKLSGYLSLSSSLFASLQLSLPRPLASSADSPGELVGFDSICNISPLVLSYWRALRAYIPS